MKNMNMKSKSIIYTMFVIAVVATILIAINWHNVSQLEEGITVNLLDGSTIVIGEDDIESLGGETFLANRSNEGVVYEEYEFEGIALIEIINMLELDVTGVETVIMTSMDTYTVELTAEEAFDAENVWIVWSEGGQAMDDDWGDYASVVRKDDGSRRWSKQLVEITFQ